jgi:serine/threonine protein phosphatase PrpC
MSLASVAYSLRFNPKKMHIDYWEFTDVGKVRSANEDSLGSAHTPHGHLFVVSDGMGGHKGGATASALAVKSIIEFFRRPREGTPDSLIRAAIEFANTQIFATALHEPELQGMGATCVVLLITPDGRAWYGHVGDSRIYLYRKASLQALTKDHSWVQYLVDTGEITQAEAANHPQKNRILRALGTDEDVKPDVPVQAHPLKDDDVFLLCSDGLCGLLEDAELQQLMNNSPVSEMAARCLQAALDKGGTDNVSVLLVRVKNPETQLDATSRKRRNKLMMGLGALVFLLAGWATWLYLKPTEPIYTTRNKTSLPDTARLKSKKTTPVDSTKDSSKTDKGKSEKTNPVNTNRPAGSTEPASKTTSNTKSDQDQKGTKPQTTPQNQGKAKPSSPDTSSGNRK